MPILNPLPGDRDPSPERDHHYAFSNHTVWRTFAEHPEAAITGTLFMDEDWLRFLWFDDTAPAVPRPTGDVGLTCEVITFAPVSLRLVLFTLPKPWFTTGAYLVAAAVLRRFEQGLPDVFRVFALERTVSEDEEEAAILGGWHEGQHSNYGPIRAISREAFLEAVVRKMDPSCGLVTSTLDFSLTI